MASLSVQRCRVSALGEPEREQWRALAERAVEPNPFLEPELLVPAVEQLDGGARVEMLVVRDGERWLGCVAVRTQPKWSSLWLPAVRTWRNPYGFLDIPLVDRDALPAVAEALAGAVRAWPGRAFLVVEHGSDGPIADALLSARRRGPRPLAFARAQRAALFRRSQDDYVSSFVSGKRRRELGRTRRLLERETGGVVRLVDATDDPAATDRFLALEGAGWKGRAGTALASDPAHERFLRRAAAGFAARGRLRMLELRCGEQVVAALLCVVAGRTLFTLKIGYDETLASGAPGVLLLVDVASWFHAQADLDRVDSCADPDHPTINRLWPDRRPLVSLVLPAAGPLGRAAVAVAGRRKPERS